MNQLRCLSFVFALSIALFAHSRVARAVPDAAPPTNVKSEPAAVEISEEEEPGPVELIFFARFESNLQKLNDIVQQANGLAGHDEWQDDGVLFEVLSEVSLEKILANSDAAPPKILYDLYITAPLSGSADYGMAVVAAFPRSAFGDDDGLVDFEVDSLQIDDQGFATAPDQDEILLLLDGDTVFLSAVDGGVYPGSRELLLETQTEFRRHPPQDAFAITFSPQQIRPSLRKPFADSILATLNAAIQQRDNENEFQFRSRETWGKSVAALIDVAANQIDSIHYSLNARSAKPGIELTLSIDAVPNSQFDAWMTTQRNCNSNAVRYLHPNAATMCLFNLSLPDVLKQTIPPLATAAAAELQHAGLVSASAAHEISSTANNLVAYGSLELLLQFIPDAQGRFAAVVCVPLHDSPDFSNAVIELVSLVEDGDMQVAHADIDGWPVHHYPIEPDSVLPNGDAVQFVVTDNLLMTYIGPSESHDVLTDIIRLNFEPAPENADYRRRGFVFRMESLDALRMMGNIDDMQKHYFGDLDDATIAAEDTVTIMMHEEVHKLEFTATFDRSASVIGMVMYGGWIEAILTGANF
jgi:hypothetical protein